MAFAGRILAALFQHKLFRQHMLPIRMLCLALIALPLVSLETPTVLSACRPSPRPVATSVSSKCSIDSNNNLVALQIRPDSELWPAASLDMLLFIAAYAHLSSDMHSFLGSASITCFGLRIKVS